MMRIKRLLLKLGLAVVVVLTLGYWAMDFWLERVLSSVQSIEATSDNKDERPQLKSSISREGSEDSSNQTDHVLEIVESETEAYTPEITSEKIVAAETNITFSDKMKVTTTLVRRLNASDIRRLSSMSSMSLEEKQEAKALFLEKLTEQEYDELIVIATKLGLSEGQTYAESVGE